ncbi:hypothetical protein C3L23_00070 [Nautilia sp. PV-1]|uniref:hypothetical protein n=1 Tax=Nautilia sp. PV-1 TaxID=2579250 RepID=UPI000FD6EA35|nr:hypothetical protein [Nautilia sp. PV-1]AZV45728.1 hypothetical protein C3L23_00070 [Nautilia sp. PV-1]
MKKSTKILLSSIAASILLIGCGGGGGSGSSSASTTGTVSGTAVDGPVSYAKVCLDLNFNQKCDSNEPVATTDASGKFSITYNLSEQNSSIAPVLMLPTPDSKDIYTGNVVTVSMSAPRAGHSTLVVSPITTVAAAAVYQKVENNETVTPDVVEEVVNKVAEALDLNGTDITQVNPTEDPKLLVTAVTLANVIEDGNITQVATNIVDNNETNITAALPADYQSVYETIVNSVDENTSLESDQLQQLVESSLDSNDTTVLEKVVSDNNVTDADIAQALVEGQLNVIYNDLNSSGLLALNAPGFDYNISDMNSTYVAEQLVNEYNITDAKTLMEEYKNTDLEVNLTTSGNETNLSSAIEMYNVLQAVRAFKNSAGVQFAGINLANVTIYRAGGDGSPLYFDQNGSFSDYLFDEDNGTLNQNGNGVWNELEDVVVLKYNNFENPAYVGVEETNNTLVPVVGYDASGQEFNDNVVITNLTPVTEVNSSTEIAASILNAQFGEFNATDINGSTYITQTGTTLTFNTDGTILLNGKDIGDWSVDANGAIVLPYYEGKVYVLKGKDLSDYSSEAYFVFVDASGHVLSIQERTFTKYVENADAVLLAKNIFSSLRTQINSVSNADENGTLDMEANKFNEQLQDITFDNIETAGNTLASLISGIVDSNLSGTVELDNPDLNRTFTLSTDDNLTYSYSIKDDLNGTVKEYNGTIVLNQQIPEDLNSSFDITMNVVGQLPASDEEEVAQDINTSIELKYDADTYTFDLLVSKMNVTDENKSIEASNIEIEAAGTDQNLSELKYVKLNSFTIDGKAGDFEADGTVNVQYVQNPLVKAESNDQAFKYYYNINGYFVCMDDNGNEEFNMTLPNELNISIDGTTYQLPVNPSDAQQQGAPWYNVFATVESSNEIDIDDWYYSLEGAVESQVVCNDANYTAHIYDNYGQQTIWVDEDDDFLNDGWVPNNITFTGTVRDVNTSTTLQGTISASSNDIGSVDLENTEGLNTEISLAVKLIREGFADTNVNSTFTSSVDGSTTLDLSYNVDGTDFGTVTLSGKWDDNGNGTVTVTSTSGLKVTIPVKNGDIDYTNSIPVYVTDKVVGYIEQRDGIPVIKYNDGTFESIN